MGDKNYKIWNEIIRHLQGVVPLSEIKMFEKGLRWLDCYDEFMENLNPGILNDIPSRQLWYEIVMNLRFKETPSGEPFWRFIDCLHYLRIVITYGNVTQSNNLEPLKKIPYNRNMAYILYKSLEPPYIHFISDYKHPDWKFLSMRRTKIMTIYKLIDKWIK